jgi:signal transduction histidine kinase/putative methionine-R-sulfoxide reductase with GAF domain
MGRKYKNLEQIVLGFCDLMANPSDEGNLAQVVLDYARTVSRTDHTGLYLWKEDVQQALIHATSPPGLCDGEERKSLRLAPRVLPNDGPLAAAVKKRKSVLVPDIDSWSGTIYRADPGSKSELDVPILFKGRRLGALFLSSNKVNGLTSEDRQLFNLVGPMIGTAILLDRQAQELELNSKTLKEAVANSARRVDFITAINNYVGKGPVTFANVAEFNRLVFTEFHKMLPSSYLSHWSYNGEDDLLILRDWLAPDNEKFVLPTDYRSMLMASESLMGRSLPRAGEILVIKAWLRKEDIWENCFDRNETRPLKDYRNQSLLEWLKPQYFIPLPLLTAENRLLGFFCVHTNDRLDFGKKHFEAISLAIGRAENLLCNHIRKTFRDRLLGEIFPQIVAFQGKPQAWNRMTRFVTEQLNCEACSIFLHDQKRERLVLAGTTGIWSRPDRTGDLIPDEQFDQVFYVRDPKTGKFEGGTGYCFESKSPQFGYDRKLDPTPGCIRGHQKGKYVERPELGTQSKSLLFVPIFRPGASEPTKCESASAEGESDVIGVIRCLNKKSVSGKDFPRFRQEDLETLGSIAHTFALFWTNYQEMVRREQKREDFLSLAGHELSLPIVASQSHLDMVKQLLPLPHRVLSQKLKDLDDELKHASFIVSSIPLMLEMAPYRFERQRVFGDIIFQCLSITETECRARRIMVELSEQDVHRIPLLHLDRHKIQQVIYNLLSNAIKYSHDKTTVTIRVKDAADGYYLSFENYGLGVPEGEEEKIFERYERGSNVKALGYVGSGWGLFLSRGIMRKHGGDLVLTRNSDPTILTLFFPKWLSNTPPRIEEEK